jgi:hypothetical protein
MMHEMTNMMGGWGNGVDLTQSCLCSSSESLGA